MIERKTVLLKPSAIEPASQVLVEAFNEDPMFRYLGIETEDKKSQINIDALTWFCKFSLRNCQPYNRIYTTAGDLKGVAVWIPPGKSEMTFWQLLKMLFVLPQKCGWHKFGQCLFLFSTLEKRHQQEMSEPHWLLSLIGVSPAYRGQGIGSLLLEPVLEQADREGLPCYLSTFTPQAVGFYQKHGFEILWQGKVSDNSPRIWTMKRISQSRSSIN